MSDVDDLARHIAFKRDGRELAPRIAEHMLASLGSGGQPDYQTLLLAAAWPAPHVAFHTASRAHRDEIAAEGLRVSQPGADGTDAWPDPDRVWAKQQAGVYVDEVQDTCGKWSRWEHWDV